MFSRFFIERPIFAAVVAIILVLAGAVAMKFLPVEQYPTITPVQVTVSATYPGADSKTLADSVAAPIEAQINGVDNMLYMSSTSSSTGQLSLTVYFSLNTDPDIAQVQVQNRVNLALPQLPSAVTQQGVSVQKRSSSIMMLLALYPKGGRYSADFVANYANVYVLDALKRVKGAGQAQILGVPDQAMRIWMNPDRMASLSITTSDIANAVNAQNQLFGAGQIGQAPNAGPVEMTFPVVTQAPFTDPKQYENIILRASQNGSAIVRLGDVARAEVGLRQYIVNSKLNNVPATFIAVYQQSGANGLVVSAAVRKTMEDLKTRFPEGIDYTISLDTNDFVRISIKEVIKTLFEAIVLVVLIVYLFLQSFRTTDHLHSGHPGGARHHVRRHAGDGILDQPPHPVRAGAGHRDGGGRRDRGGGERRAQHGRAPSRAARGHDQVDERDRQLAGGGGAGDVLGIRSRGLPARQHRPALQAVRDHDRGVGVDLRLRCLDAHAGHVRHHAEAHPATRSTGFFGWFNRKVTQVTDAFGHAVTLVIKRMFIALALLVVLMAGIYGLFHILPTSFVPQEDQGYAMTAIIMPEAASIDRTQAVAEKVDQALAKIPGVENRAMITGYSLLDSGFQTTAAHLFHHAEGLRRALQEYRDGDARRTCVPY